MEKLTSSTGPFSIATLNYQRVSCVNHSFNDLDIIMVLRYGHIDMVHSWKVIIDFIAVGVDHNSIDT